MNILCQMEPVENLSSLEKLALHALERRGQMLSYQLPNRIGYKTMTRLVAKGFAVVVNPEVGRFAQDYGWRLADRTAKIADR